MYTKRFYAFLKNGFNSTPTYLLTLTFTWKSFLLQYHKPININPKICANLCFFCVFPRIFITILWLYFRYEKLKELEEDKEREKKPEPVTRKKLFQCEGMNHKVSPFILTFSLSFLSLRKRKKRKDHNIVVQKVTLCDFSLKVPLKMQCLKKKQKRFIYLFKKIVYYIIYWKWLITYKENLAYIFELQSNWFISYSTC